MRSRTRLMCFAGVLIGVLILVGCGTKKTATQPPKKNAAKKTQPGKKTDSSKPHAQQPSASANGQKPLIPGLIQPGFDLDDYFNPPGPDDVTTPLGDQHSQLTDGRKPAKPPSVPGPDQRPTAKQLLTAIQGLYRAAQSVRIHGLSDVTIKYDGKVVQRSKDVKFSILFKRPNKFVTSDPASRVSSDGKTVYTHAAGPNRYVKTAMSDQVLQGLVASKMGVGVMGLLLGADYAPALSSIKLLKDAKVNGKAVYVLSLKLKKGVGCPPDVDATQKLWIGKNDLAIYKNELVTKVKPKPTEGHQGELPKTIQTAIVGRLTRFEPNAKLPDSAFRFKPPAGAKPFEPPKQVNLMGKNAPDFSFKWTDGSTRKLSDFRGKTTLLDFWVMPQCEQQLPVLQNVCDQHAGVVEMITVNLNSKPEAVKKYLQEKGFSFPTVYADEQIVRVIREEYGVQALPMMFILDDKGVVRRIMVGVPTEKDIAAKIANVQAAQ